MSYCLRLIVSGLSLISLTRGVAVVAAVVVEVVVVLRLVEVEELKAVVGDAA